MVHTNGSRSRYSSGTANHGMNFAYALYRNDMKKVGLNPDCNIEAEITYERGADRYDRRSNPWLATARNDNTLSYKANKVVQMYYKNGEINTLLMSLGQVVVVLVLYHVLNLSLLSLK